jgi:hypothetical protein
MLVRNLYTVISRWLKLYGMSDDQVTEVLMILESIPDCVCLHHWVREIIGRISVTNL